MDIKEQKPNVIKELDDYILVVCNNWSDYDHAIEVKHLITIDEVVAKIQSIYEQAGYIQLQADDKGLVDIDLILKNSVVSAFKDGSEMNYRGVLTLVAKTQKALDDKEWEEKIESFWNGNYGYYVIPVREWELLKSQMKEGK